LLEAAKVVSTAMARFITVLAFLYLMFTNITVYLFDKSLNKLPNGVARSNKISLKILIILSSAIALLPIFWFSFLYLAMVDRRFLALFVLFNVIFVVCAVLEISLRSGGNEPDLGINLFETTFEEWSAIEPHQGKKYITPDFHDEYKHHYRSFKPRNTGLYLVPSGSESGSIVVSDGFRQTVGNPNSVSSTIHVLGGSTTFCAETPNNLTYSSILQAKINVQFKSVRVLNYGFSGATLPKLVERVESSSVNSQDLIVAYIGINEAAHLMITERKKILGPFKWLPRFDELVTVLSRKSLVLEWLKNTTIDQKWEIFDEGIFEVERSLDRLIEFSEKRGVFLLLVLQPNLFTKKMYSKYEHELLNHTSTEFKNCINISYDKLEKLFFSKKSPKLVFRTAVSLMDKFEISPFLDTFHVNDEGNAAIADFIFDSLQNQMRDIY
jgi:lysophospholipase L1-like esterase